MLKTYVFSLHQPLFYDEPPDLESILADVIMLES